jgi:aromatic-L-amino-acid decarboxylase
VEKAAIVLGIGERNVVRIATDTEFSMHADAVRGAIEADERVGAKPLAVVATVGTTSTASVDRIREINSLCVEKNIWFHVDAAYGGAMGAMPEGRWATDGIETADSVVVNPHKWLFVPLDFSALYTRHPELLRSVFALVPEYLDGDSGNGGFPDYMDYGVQLGRRFRALKAWMVFRSFGKTGISSRIREHCRLAQLFASWVRDSTDFVLGAPVHMGVVCFRFSPDGKSDAKADSINERVVESVNSSGLFYLTHTRLRGTVFLRIGLGNVLTTETHLAAAWRAISHEAARLAAG